MATLTSGLVGRPTLAQRFADILSGVSARPATEANVRRDAARDQANYRAFWAGLRA